MDHEKRDEIAGKYSRAIIQQLPRSFKASWDEWLVIEQGIKDQVIGAMILAGTQAQKE